MARLPPFSGTPEEPPSKQQSSSWRSSAYRTARSLLATVVSVGATYLGACFAALIIYAVVFPPLTGIQLQRSLEAHFTGAPGVEAYAPIPLATMDPDLPRAVVAGEDSRFFKHGGIDWEAVNEALKEYRRGEDLRGGSTITQQLVKNLFMTTHRSYLRKAMEVPLTYGAELVLSKRRILELYLNVIEWGPGIYGAKAAAQHYYGTSADRLTRAQAAALAACIPNPLVRRPATVGWYQRIILRRMRRLPPLPLSHNPEPRSSLFALSAPNRIPSSPR